LNRLCSLHLNCASNAESIPEHIADDLGRLACPLLSCPSIQITSLMRAMARLFFCCMAEAGGEAQGRVLGFSGAVSRVNSYLVRGEGNLAIKPYRTYLYRNKVLVITKVTTQDTPKLVSKELWHRLYRNPKLPTNTVRQSTATSQFNRSPRVAPNAFKQLVIVQKHTLTPTRIIKPPISSVREVPPRRLP
jgi:hypothetical protein